MRRPSHHLHRRRHGPRPALRLRHWHERWLYAAGAALWITGSAWLVSHFELESDGLPAPSEAWWMRAHGAALIVFLVLIGALLPYHVLPGWRQPRNRVSGIVMLSVVLLLTLTGYGLYYAAGESLRGWLSTVHWAVGLCAAGLLAAHALLGRHSRQA